MQEATLTFAEIISGARIIPLSQGKITFVDAEDYAWAKNLKWHYKDGYAVSLVSLNRSVLGTPNGMEADHKNRNTLDNRRHNLRNATKAQNMQNKATPRSNTSGFKGVSAALRGKWKAKISVNSRQIHLGYFSTPELAHAAYAAAAKEHHGEFARLV